MKQKKISKKIVVFFSNVSEMFDLIYTVTGVLDAIEMQ